MIRNTRERFGTLSMTLHWVMVVLIFTLLGLGKYMTELPDGDPKWELYGLHKSLGLMVFLMTIVRLTWIRTNPGPPLPGGLRPRERRAASFVHGYLYFAMIALPVSGYIDSSAGGYHLAFFEWFDIPKVVPENEVLEKWMIEIHGWIANGLILVLMLHLAAVFKHHFVLKDDVLLRMLPGRARRT